MSFGDFFSGIGDTIGIAFDWLNNSENARAADFISGAALAGINYVAEQDKQNAARELVELQERRADDRKKVNYAGVGGYTGGLTAATGVLTNGLLSKAGQEKGMPSVDDGYGNAKTTKSRRSTNNDQNKGQGDGRARFAAAQADRLRQQQAAVKETQSRDRDRQSQIKAAEEQRLAEQKAENKRVAEAAEKAASKARNKEGILSARDRRERVPVGSAWSKPPPGERNRDPLERLNRSSGRGMQNQGDAFYPTGFAESLEDNMPSGFGRGLLASPMASVVSTVGKTAYNQTQYGMNKDAADLYKELIADPANEGKTVQELVQMARQPQMDNQKSNAFINDETGSTANEAQLNAMRPFIKDLNMSEDQWNGLPIEMKRQLARDVNNSGSGGGGGGLLATSTTSVGSSPEESTYTTLDSYLKLFGNNTFQERIMLEQNAQQPDQQQGMIQGEQQQQAPTEDSNPEESYKIISGQMMNLLYDSSDSILETLRAGGQQESATVLARIMVMSINSLKMSGKRVEPGMMLMAMVELSKGLGEMAIKEGVMDDDPRMIEESFFAAIAKADEELQEEALSQEDREVYSALMGKLRQLQQSQEKSQTTEQPTEQPMAEEQPQPEAMV